MGILKSYHTPSFNDASWGEIEVAESGESLDTIEQAIVNRKDAEHKSGFAWYRKWIDIPREWEGEKLEIRLGNTADPFICFWNGEMIGEKKELSYENKIPVPDNLVRFQSSNLLAIRAWDKLGEGNYIEGPIILMPRFPWDEFDLVVNAQKNNFVYDIYTPIQLDLIFRNPFEESLDILLKMRIRDFDDLTVYNEQIAIGLNGQTPTNLIMDLPPLPPGHYRCRFDIVTDKIKLEDFEFSIAVIGGRIVYEERERSPFGICGLDLTAQDRERSEAEENHFIRLQKMTGAAWNRSIFSWRTIEPEMKEWDFTFADRIIERYNLSDISLFINLARHFVPGDAGVDEVIREYAQYARIMGSRYKNRAHFWEIAYKPNNPEYWSYEPYVESYARLLKTSYHAIKQSDEEAIIIGMATRGTDLEYIEKALAAGAGDYMDILSIHPEPTDSPVKKTGESDLDKIRSLHEIMEQQGFRKPVWITECGWQGVGPVSERLQAEYLVKFHIGTLAEGMADKIFWRNLVDGWESPFSRRGYYGLFHNDYAPKPAFAAYYTMVNKLHDFTAIKRLNLPEGIYGYEALFSDSRKVRIFWTEGESRTIGVQPGSRIFDMVGKPCEETGGRMLIDRNPRYVEGEWD